MIACGWTAAGDRPVTVSSHDHDIVLGVNPALHQRFGLAYPVTYILHCESEESGLRAWIRYNAGSAWTQLTEYSAGQFFNGVDAVRFDNDTHVAYVSAALSPASDTLHMRVTSADGSPVHITYSGVARFYDNRDGAVLASVDDWKDYTDTMFTRVAKILRSYHLPYTAAVITGATTDSTWAHLQAELDAGDMEVASHTRTHAGWPYTDLVNQITGSRADLIEHLSMPAQYRRGETEYVYSFLVPFGETSAEIETTVTHSGYLNTRVVMYQNGEYTPWDTAMGRFRYDGTSKEMGSPYGTTDAAELNAVFDARLAAHGIYHLLLHPYYLVPSREIYSEFFREHMTHISNRTNIWYTTFGHLYVYRLLGDSTVKNTMWPGSRPVITLNPASQSVVDSTGVSFSCAASGTSPLSYQWQRNGVDIPEAESGVYTIAMVTRADSGTTYRCIVANGFGADTSSAAILRVIPTFDGSGIISDDFNATALNTTLWTVANPRGDASVGLTGGGTADAELAISVPAGVAHDLWTEGMTAPRITQPASNTDLSIEAKFDAPMTASNQTQGLLIIQDSLNLIRLDLVYDQGNVSFFAATFTSGVPAVQSMFEVPLTAPYYLRLRRTGDQWNGFHSSDGISWTEAVTFSHELNVKHVGAWVGNAGASAPAFTGLIDYFFNSSAPIIGEDGPDVRVPPLVTADPAGTTRYEGDSVRFAVSATGTAPLSYRWQRNGVDVAGGTVATLLLSAVSRADSGALFRCIVANVAGSDTSAAAMLHVLPAPTPQSGVKISLFVLLQGAMDGDSMRTDLARANLLPLDHPFANEGWVPDGPDSVGSFLATTVDWVMVEFRSSIADTTVCARRAAFLHNGGAVTGLDGTSPVCVPSLSAGSYYIVVRHRNHLPVMSATALALDTVTTTFDLRTAPTKYYGGEAVALPCGRYAMLAGNADVNKGIGATDLARIRVARSSTPSYNDADVDLSGTVTASDLTLARENIGRTTRVP
jgi:hypothetical protein